MSLPPQGSASARYVSSNLYYDHVAATLYNTTFEGSNYNVKGTSSSVRIYDRNATPTNYWEIYNNPSNYLNFTNSNASATNPVMYVGATGGLVVEGTGAGLYLRTRTSPSTNTNNFQLYTTGATGSSTMYWNSTNLGSQMYLNDTGVLTIDSAGAELRLAFQDAGGSMQLYATAGSLTFKNSTLTNPSFYLNGYGWQMLDGAQARLQLNSQTASSADYWSIFSTGATAAARLRYSYYNGTTSINPFDVLNTGSMLMGTTTTAMPTITLQGNSGVGQLKGSSSACGLVEIDTASIVRLATNTSSTTCVQLRISGTTAGLGVWDFQYGGTSQSVASVINANTASIDAAHIEVYHITAHGTAQYFYTCLYNGTAIGGLKQTASNTITTITTSDYRLKDDVKPLDEQETGNKIDRLKPCSFTWKTDGTKDAGFLAHEFAESFPKSVFGQKDAVKENGEIDQQMLSVSSTEIIATLVAELQFLRKRVAALESKIV